MEEITKLRTLLHFYTTAYNAYIYYIPMIIHVHHVHVYIYKGKQTTWGKTPDYLVTLLDPVNLIYHKCNPVKSREYSCPDIGTGGYPEQIIW